MNRCQHEFRGALIAVLVIACFTNSTGADSPSSRWKVGDIWNFAIRPAGKQPYRMHVMVVGVETVKGAACWQLNCHPNDDAPSYLKRYRMFVDQKTGSPLRVLRLPDKQEIAVETAGAASFLTALPDGMPLELFNPADLPTGKADLAGTSRRVEVRKQVMADHFVLEMNLFDNDVEQWKVRQQWVAGEKWWHSYERTVKGKTTLTAKRMHAAPLKTEVAAKRDRDPTDLARRFPLRYVPALRKKVPMAGSDVQLAEMLEALRFITGFEMTLADNLSNHDPKFPELQGGQNATAWMVMERIAEIDLDDGRWEKTDDGYRLEGVSRALRTPPPKSYAWVWAVSGVALALTAAGGAVAIYRRRGRKPALVSTNKSPPSTSPASPKRKGI